MCEILVRHQVICLDGTFNIVTVYSNCHSHDHMLRALCNFAIETEEVGSLKGLKTEVLVIEISVVDNS